MKYSPNSLNAAKLTTGFKLIEFDSRAVAV